MKRPGKETAFYTTLNINHPPFDKSGKAHALRIRQYTAVYKKKDAPRASLILYDFYWRGRELKGNRIWDKNRIGFLVKRVCRISLFSLFQTVILPGEVGFFE